MARKFWFETEICGQRQKVYLATPDDPELPGPMEGITVDDKLYSLVSTALADDRKDDTALHELLHVVLDLSGARFNAYDSLGIPVEQWAKIEEKIIRSITPPLHVLIKRYGFKFPKRPKIPKKPKTEIEVEWYGSRKRSKKS